MGKTIEIPEGYEARIEGNKVILERKENEDERIRKELVFYLGDMPEDTELRNGITNRDVLVWLERQKEHKPAEWSEDNIKELTEFEAAMLHIGMSFFGGFAGLNPNNTNEVKEQAKLLLKLVPKQEWSEEDEKYLKLAYDLLVNGVEADRRYPELISWLKCLRPAWKPSEEQMEMSYVRYIMTSKN